MNPYRPTDRQAPETEATDEPGSYLGPMQVPFPRAVVDADARSRVLERAWARLRAAGYGTRSPKRATRHECHDDRCRGACGSRYPETEVQYGPPAPTAIDRLHEAVDAFTKDNGKRPGVIWTSPETLTDYLRSLPNISMPMWTADAYPVFTFQGIRICQRPSIEGIRCEP